MKVQGAESVEKEAADATETLTKVERKDKPKKVCANKAPRPQGRRKESERVHRRIFKESWVLNLHLQGNKVEDVPYGTYDLNSGPSDLEIDDLNDDEEAVVPEIKADWWGHKQGFIFGGLLGARSNKLCKARSSDDNSAYVRKTFAEEDQENLYNLVQVWTCDKSALTDLSQEVILEF